MIVCAVIFFIIGYISANANLFSNDSSNLNNKSINPDSDLTSNPKQIDANEPIAQPSSDIVSSGAIDLVKSDSDIHEMNNENKVKVEKLELELERVKNEIERIKNENSDYAENQYANEGDKPPERSTAKMTANLDAIEEFLPDPFSSIMLDSSDDIKQQFENMNSESDDYDWANLMEQQIGDFVVLHELSAFIDAFVVKCNAGICELRGFEKQDNAWRKVMMDVEVQPWWMFSNTSSRTTNNGDYGLYFYVMASTSH